MIELDFDTELPSRILYGEEKKIIYWNDMFLEKLIVDAYITSNCDALEEYIESFCPGNSVCVYNGNCEYIIDIICCVLWKKDNFYNLLDAFINHDTSNKNILIVLDNIIRSLCINGYEDDTAMRSVIVNYIFTNKRLKSLCDIYKHTYLNIIEKYNYNYKNYLYEFKQKLEEL